MKNEMIVIIIVIELNQHYININQDLQLALDIKKLFHQIFLENVLHHHHHQRHHHHQQKMIKIKKKLLSHVVVVIPHHQ
jgi:hypothetical protein